MCSIAKPTSTRKDLDNDGNARMQTKEEFMHMSSHARIDYDIVKYII